MARKNDSRVAVTRSIPRNSAGGDRGTGAAHTGNEREALDQTDDQPVADAHGAFAAFAALAQQLGVPHLGDHITPLQRISAKATTHRLRSGPSMNLLSANPTTATGIDPTITAQASA